MNFELLDNKNNIFWNLATFSFSTTYRDQKSLDNISQLYMHSRLSPSLMTPHLLMLCMQFHNLFTPVVIMKAIEKGPDYASWWFACVWPQMSSSIGGVSLVYYYVVVHSKAVVKHSGGFSKYLSLFLNLAYSDNFLLSLCQMSL